MKISKFSLLIFIFSMIYSNSYGALIYPMAKITIKALDNDGAPIPIADVTFNFDYAKDPGMGWGTKTETVEGKTDNYGMFTITKPAAGKCSFRVNKDGFYDSSKSYEFKETTALFTWSPWNPTVEINLKKIINPTTMYAKNTAAMKVPALESPVGYDLVKGDWVAPYGKGTVSDFIFQFKVLFKSNDDWDVSYKLTFSNQNDGIQEYLPDDNNQSIYSWPYEAPNEGYKKEINWSAYYHPGGWSGVHKSDRKENRKYIFRVRTKTDQNGNVIEAKYGRIIGDIVLSFKGYTGFVYFFNFSGSKSLEYDFKNPLFKWSSKEWEHEVKGP